MYFFKNQFSVSATKCFMKKILDFCILIWHIKKNIKTFSTVELCVFNAQKRFDFEFYYEFVSGFLGQNSKAQYKGMFLIFVQRCQIKMQKSRIFFIKRIVVLTENWFLKNMLFKKIEK